MKLNATDITSSVKDNQYTISDISSDNILEVEFEAITYTLTITATGNGSATFNSTVVKDYTEAAHLVYQLGYELKYEVSRRREELSMGDTISIYIDKVDGLPGYYGRIESDLSDTDNPEEAFNDLVETFRVLKVKGKPIEQSYGELLESSEHDTIAG